MTPNTEFKKIRLAQNLSQIEFAAKLQVSQGTVTDIERGRIGVSKNVRKKLKENIGIDWQEIQVSSDPEKSVNDEGKFRGKVQGGVQGGQKSFEDYFSKGTVKKIHSGNFKMNMGVKLLFDIQKNHPEQREIFNALNALQNFEFVIDNLNQSYFESIENQIHSINNYIFENRFDYELYKADYIEKLNELEPIKRALIAIAEAIDTFYSQIKEYDTKNVVAGYLGDGILLDKKRKDEQSE